MALAEGIDPALLIGGRWTATLAEGHPELTDLLEGVSSFEPQCASTEALAVTVIDRSDETTPDSLESTIIWLDTFAPLITVARSVDPSQTEEWVGVPSVESSVTPQPLDLAAMESCELVEAGLLGQISDFGASWDGLSPLELAASPPGLDLGNAVQAARLRSAELGCNVLALSRSALLAIATRPSESFVGRAQRLTYAEWILATMVEPNLINTEDPVYAEPIGGPDGLSGFSVSNRSDATQGDVVLTVEGTRVYGPETLQAGASAWVAYPAGPTIPDYSVDWAR
jgi:hypothetical protein